MTRERILDVAELLFAQKGTKETSLRRITGEAGVNIASIKYHFGSKDGLIKALLRRRLDPINRERMKRLKAIRKAAEDSGSRPCVRDLMHAIFEPILTFTESCENAENFLRFVARAMIDPDETVKEIFLSEMKDVLFLLFQLMKEACPNTPPDRLFWHLQFSLGAMGHALYGRGHLKLVPPGVNSAAGSKKVLEYWLDFVCNGIDGAR